MLSKLQAMKEWCFNTCRRNFHISVNPKLIFAGPQIKDLLKDKNFKAQLKGTEQAACEVFKVVADNLPSKHEVPNNRKLVENMLETFMNIGRNMSLKLHFLHSPLGFFPATLEMSVMSMVSDFTKTCPC
jgi:hypothetical protein